MPAKAVVFSNRVKVPSSALSLDGFRKWAHSPKFPKRGKISFVSDEVYLDMSPEEIRSHLSVKGDVFGALWSFCRLTNVGIAYADGAFLVNEEAGLATEPDLMFCRHETIESGQVHLRELVPGSGRQVEIHGSPDLVVEIVSKSSVTKDKKRLRDAYFRAGITEYWLIDARGEVIEFDVLTRGESGYVAAIADENGFRSSVALAKQVCLTRELNRIGGWRYTLDIV